ncbi:MAG: hypothetical protein ACREFN_19015, partial [Acetobacteraceae bacterium]
IALRAMLKSALRPCWRLARPIVRPLAWRTRGFLIGPIEGSLIALRAEQERLAAEISATRGTAGEVEAVAMAVEAALLTVTTARIDSPPGRDPGQAS